MDDTGIVEMFNQRSEQAIAAAEKQYGGLCFSIANNILHCLPDAEECVNDALLAAWETIPPAKPESLSAYLAKITRNKAVCRYRKNSALKRGGGSDAIISELNEDTASPSDTESLFNEHLAAKVINSYLRGVSKSKASIFIQRYFMCFSVEDISAASGRSYNSVVTLLHRMRKELKEKLRREGIDI